MTGEPVWWHWPLDISPHAFRRMQVRGFSETDLRIMLHEPRDITQDACPGRFLVAAQLGGRLWHVIVEPDHDAKHIIVVTAYAPDPTP